jgi:hypothetical protein
MKLFMRLTNVRNPLKLAWRMASHKNYFIGILGSKGLCRNCSYMGFKSHEILLLFQKYLVLNVCVTR